MRSVGIGFGKLESGLQGVILVVVSLEQRLTGGSV